MAERDACIIALTWLDVAVSGDEVSLDNFAIFRADRTRGLGKKRGDGVCIYVNNRWCNNIKIHSQIFPIVVISCVYIPPTANIKAAAEQLAEGANGMLARYPEAPLFIVCCLYTVLWETGQCFAIISSICRHSD